jgi:hypothetical protein
VNADPTLVVKYCHFITFDGQVFCSIQHLKGLNHDLLLQVFSNQPAGIVTSLLLTKVRHFEKREQLLEAFVFQHWTLVLQQMENNGKLINLPHTVTNLTKHIASTSTYSIELLIHQI